MPAEPHRCSLCPAVSGSLFDSTTVAHAMWLVPVGPPPRARCKLPSVSPSLLPPLWHDCPPMARLRRPACPRCCCGLASLRAVQPSGTACRLAAGSTGGLVGGSAARGHPGGLLASHGAAVGAHRVLLGEQQVSRIAPTMAAVPASGQPGRSLTHRLIRGPAALPSHPTHLPGPPGAPRPANGARVLTSAAAPPRTLRASVGGSRTPGGSQFGPSRAPRGPRRVRRARRGREKK